MKKVALSGSSGFIGSHLISFFKEKGIVVVPVTRKLLSDIKSLEETLYECDAVINLAGATINRRWTEAYKKEIMTSRVETTRILVETINRMKKKPTVFISVSAIGIYSPKGVHTENQKEYGNNFLTRVCMNWESEARKLSPEVRLIIPRFGMVLSNDGGALPKILLPFKLFLGGQIGDGQQGFSWIHIDDLTEAMYFVMQKPQLKGVYNFTAPQLLTNDDFSRIVAKELHRPNWLQMPSFIFNIIYGEGHVIATEGQQALPDRLQKDGYSFKYNNLNEAIHNLYPIQK